MTSQGLSARIAKLNLASEQKRQDAWSKTEMAINNLIKRGERITFRSVADEAKVSVSYLYKYDEIKDRIQELRKKQEEVGRPPKPQSASEKSKQAIIIQFRERIKRLEAEVQGLRRVNEGITGRLHQLLGYEELASRLLAENAELKQQLDECRRHRPAPLAADEPYVTSLSKKRHSKTDITDGVKIELDALGIKLNSTLSRKIRAASESVVLSAIEALKQAMESGEVKNPGGWLANAIENGWTKNEPQPRQTSTYNPTVYTAPEESSSELVDPEQMKELLKGLK